MQSGNYNRKALIAALVGAALCLLFQRLSVFSLFFLVPFGVVAYSYDYRVAWFSFLMALVGNIFMTVSTAFAAGGPIEDAFWDLLFFVVIASVFSWITAPPPGLSRRIKGVVRLITGSCIGAWLFTVILFRAIASPSFSEYVNTWVNGLASLYHPSASDGVQNAIFENFTADTIISAMKSIMLRGGSLVSIVFMLYICQQISLFLSRMFHRARGAKPSRTGTLMAFHVYPIIIWVFSGALFLVVLFRITGFQIPEIILWNILVLCVILYFAQGLGILQFFLARPLLPPFLRFFLLVMLVVLIFSPVLNAVFFVGIILLGIAENWASFRAPKNNGPPSTPGAGGIRN